MPAADNSIYPRQPLLVATGGMTPDGKMWDGERVVYPSDSDYDKHYAAHAAISDHNSCPMPYATAEDIARHS